MSHAVVLAGLGGSLPRTSLSNEDLAPDGPPSDRVQMTVGPVCRHFARGETTLSLAREASEMALEQACCAPQAIDLIVSASSSPAQAVPCTASLLQRELRLPDGKSACFDIDATCLSFVAALQTVTALIATDCYSHALIASSEISSCSLNPGDPQTSLLFGDAAAAAVVRRAGPDEPGRVVASRITTHSRYADLASVAGGGTLNHPNAPATTADMNVFHMRGVPLYRAAAAIVVPFLDKFLREIDWERREIDLVVPHQASRHALDLLTGRLGFCSDQVVETITFTGNTVAASIPYALFYAESTGRLRRGDRVLLLGTGAGLSLGALALIY